LSQWAEEKEKESNDHDEIKKGEEMKRNEMK